MTPNSPIIKATKAHPDYGGFNDLPKDYTYVSQEEFMKELFHYCIAAPDSKQCWTDGNLNPHSMMGGKLHQLRLFNLDYESCPAMGYGIEKTYEGEIMKKEVIKYFRYGDAARWKEFIGRFAAQFAGDNS